MIQNHNDRNLQTSPVTSRDNIEAIFPLRPVQAAMLLKGNQQSQKGDGLIQVRWKVHGPLSFPEFAEAWQIVAARHQALRASVHSRDDADSMVVVWRELEVPVELVDLSDLAPEEQDYKISMMLEDNARHGLPLDQPPVQAVDVYQLDEDTCVINWRFHYLLIDGWSASRVVQEVLETCRTLAKGKSPKVNPPPCTYSDYRKWHEQLDPQGGREFWADQLAPFRSLAPRLLPHECGHRKDLDLPDGDYQCSIEPADVEQLQSFLTKHGLTVNSLCQGAWALMIQKILGQ